MRPAGRPAARIAGARSPLAFLKRSSRAGRSVPRAPDRVVVLLRETATIEWPSRPDEQRVVCSFQVPGDPLTKLRPRFGNNGVYTPSVTKQWEEKVRSYLKVAAPHIRPNRTHEIGVRLRFFTSTRQRRDVDNLAKVVLDALNGVVWGDDSQVVELIANAEHVADEPSTDVLIYTL